MGITGRGTTRAGRAARALAVVGVLGIGLLAGCSASSDSGSADSEAAPAAAAPDRGAQPAQGAAAAAGGKEGTAAGSDAAAGGAAGGSAAAGTAAARQVVTTGDVSMTATDPIVAVAAVVTLVEKAGGRVDARTENAASAPASAEVTVRVPSDDLTPTLDALKGIGTVTKVQLKADDVTADTIDLATRITSLRLSVGRMQDLLARATTNEDVVSAEAALTDRETSLEQLLSQQARLSEQVALSTLTVTITEPEATPPVSTEEPPSGFLDGLAGGWNSLVAVLRVAVIVVGAVLPWAVAAAVVAVLVILARRGLRRLRPVVPVVAAAPAGGSFPPPPGAGPTAPTPPTA